MTTTQTPLDLGAIQQRCNLATPGPWKVDYDTCDCEPDYGCGHGRFAIGFGPFSYFDTRTGEDRTADVEFIAAARTDVPALVAEVERLRAKSETLADHLGNAADKLLVLGVLGWKQVAAEMETGTHQPANGGEK